MSDKSRNGEDIASLFAAFGGDVAGYQEFTAAPELKASPGWALLQAVQTEPQEAGGATVSAPAPPEPAVRGGNALFPEPPQPHAPLPSAHRPAELVVPPLAQTLAPDPSFQTLPVFKPMPPTAATEAPPRASAPEPPAAAPSARRGEKPPQASPPSVAPAANPSGTPLTALFDRLASAPQVDVAARNSLMAHWRQSG